MLLNVAIAQRDYEESRKLMELLEERVFPAQIEKAQNLAHACYQQEYKSCLSLYKTR